MKKKIFLGMGSLLLATTSVMSVVSCDPKKPTKPIEKYKGESDIGNLIHGFLPGLLKDNAQKENILENVDKILAGGISKVKDADLKAILKSFKVSDSLSGIILKLLKSDLLERIFVKGFADIQTELSKPGATYKSKKESVKTFVESVLDAPQKGDIFTRELLTKLLVGFDDEKDLARTIVNLIKKAGVKTSGWDGFSKALFSDLPILQKGLLGASYSDWIKSFNNTLPEAKSAVPFIFSLISVKLKQLSIFTDNYNLVKNKNNFSKSIYSLINGGLKSLKGKDNDDLITFIEYVSGKKNIPTTKTPAPTTGTSKKEDPTIVKTIADILINNSEDIYTFLKYGFSQDNWKELQNKLFDILSPLVAGLIYN